MTIQRHDPLARAALVASFVLMLYLAFAPASAPIPAAQAQEPIIIIATPTLGYPQPAPVVEVQVVQAPPSAAPVAQPVTNMAANEESKPVEHQLSSAPAPIVLDPLQAKQAPDGAVLIQASDGPGFAAVLTDEGTKAVKHKLP